MVNDTVSRLIDDFQAKKINRRQLVQGAAAAGVSFAFLLCLSLSIIRESFPADRVARAIALFVGAGTAFAIVPPIVGSELMNRFGWRAGLLVAPVLAAALIALVFRYVPETPCYDRPLDVPAMLLSAVGLIGLAQAAGALRKSGDSGFFKRLREVPKGRGDFPLWTRGAGAL